MAAANPPLTAADEDLLTLSMSSQAATSAMEETSTLGAYDSDEIATGSHGVGGGEVGGYGNRNIVGLRANGRMEDFSWV